MTQFIRSNFWYLLVIVVSSVVSLDTLLFQSIRLDEAQSLWVATKSINSIIVLDAQDVLVPLYELILHFWMQIFGSTIFAARILSFIFFFLTLPFLYLLSKEASNKKVAIITVTLFSLSPFIMWYSSEARMYTLFAFITTLNSLFFLRFIRSNGATSKLGYLITSILGLYTHYFFIFLLATQFIFSVAKFILTNDSKNRVLFLKHLLLLFIICLCFLPWGIYFISLGSASNTKPLIPSPTSYNLFQSLINFLFGFQSTSIQAFIISLWPIFILSLFLVFTNNEKQDIESINYFALATFLPIVLVFLGSFIRPIFLTRYLILVTPTLFFLIAWLLSSYQKHMAHIILSVLIIVMMFLLIYQNISTTTPVKEDYQGVAEYLEQNATPSDIIAVTAPFTIYPLEYSYQGDTQIVTIPYWDRYSQGPIPPFSVNNLTKQVKSYKVQYVHIFVVFSYNQGYADKIKNYFDKHYYRNMLKDFSPGLEVREYQLQYNTKNTTKL